MSDAGQISLPASVLLQLPLTPLPLLLHPCSRAPSLQGWQWCEEKWHLDLSPQIIDACDAEGWSYGERWCWAWVQSKLLCLMMRQRTSRALYAPTLRGFVGCRTQHHHIHRRLLQAWTSHLSSTPSSPTAGARRSPTCECD